MVSLDLWVGRTAAEKEALAKLREHEDEIFIIQPAEDVDLPTHVRAEVPRFRLLRDRMSYAAAQSDRKADRNWYTTIALIAIILIKGVVPASFIAAVIRYLVGN